MYLLSDAKKGTQSFAEFNQKSSFRQIILITFSTSRYFQGQYFILEC